MDLTFEYVYFGEHGAGVFELSENCVKEIFGDYYVDWDLCKKKPLSCVECWKRKLPEQKCRVCGCTWDHPCEGGCSWVEPDLCSRCAEENEANGGDDRICPTCDITVKKSEMRLTYDCQGIPYRYVCPVCYDKVMEKGYDGEYYDERDECLDDDY